MINCTGFSKACTVNTWSEPRLEPDAMMRTHRQRCAARLVSAVAAFALVLAHLIGAYAHAAGHAHAHAQMHAGTAHHHHAEPMVDTGEAGVVDDAGKGCNDTVNHAQCCDFMCHGGVAILVSISLRYLESNLPRF